MNQKPRVHYNWEVKLSAQKIYETLKSRGYDLGEILSMTVTKTSETGRVTELVIKGTKGQRTYTREGCRTVFSLDSQWYTITSDADISVRSADDSVKKTQIAGSKVMTASGLKDLPKGNSSTIKVLGADGQKKTISAVPQNYVLTGKGWGHAVGMSQEGAKGMAKEGYNYEQILTHYFPGTKVE
jgi:stage II sporulation protein D